jgi:hypothetical protein
MEALLKMSKQLKKTRVFREEANTVVIAWVLEDGRMMKYRREFGPEERAQLTAWLESLVAESSASPE